MVGYSSCMINSCIFQVWFSKRAPGILTDPWDPFKGFMVIQNIHGQKTCLRGNISLGVKSSQMWYQILHNSLLLRSYHFSDFDVVSKKKDYQQLSERIFSFPITYLCKHRFSSDTSTKQHIVNRLNAEGDTRIQMFSISQTFDVLLPNFLKL